MKSIVLELDEGPISQNKWERLNRWIKKRMMLELRDKIIFKIGEGPWRKCYKNKKNPKFVHDQVVKELRRHWPKKRRILIEVTARVPRRYDYGNLVGGYKPLLDALQWAGWMVTDHVNWLRDIYRDQVIGDPKTVVQIYVPETDLEEQTLHERFASNGQAERKPFPGTEKGARKDTGSRVNTRTLYDNV